MSDRSETHTPSPDAALRSAETPAPPGGEDLDALPVTKTQATAPDKAAVPNRRPVQRLPTRFGRYRLVRELGRGGMGTVVLAVDTQLGRQVALKIPFLKKKSDTRTLKRFEREAKAAAALSHPNICPVYDFGTFQNLHFLSMAYLEGQPLQAFLDSGHRIPQRTAAAIIRKIAGALRARPRARGDSPGFEAFKHHDGAQPRPGRHGFRAGPLPG